MQAQAKTTTRIIIIIIIIIYLFIIYRTSLKNESDLTLNNSRDITCDGLFLLYNNTIL